MKRNLCSMTALLVFTMAAVADEPAEPSVIEESFDGKADQQWIVVREQKSHLSFDKVPGCLTVTTQRGTIHADEKNDAFSEGTQAKNIHLLKDPIPADQDFVLTLKVRRFEPKLFYHQVAIIAYVDDDNYVKWSFEQKNQTPTGTQTVLVCERQKRPSHFLMTDIDVAGPFALRLERFGSNWICSHSLDGESFQVVGIQQWDLESSADKPMRIGFLAKNGGNPAADEIDVQIDSVMLQISPFSESADQQ